MATERQYNLTRDAFGWRTAANSTVSSNSIRVDIAPERGYTTQVGRISVLDTTGTGGAESLRIEGGAGKIYEQTFTVPGDTNVELVVPVPATSGSTLSVIAAATNLTAGRVFVVYRQIPD